MKDRAKRNNFVEPRINNDQAISPVCIDSFQTQKIAMNIFENNTINDRIGVRHTTAGTHGLNNIEILGTFPHKTCINVMAFF